MDGFSKFLKSLLLVPVIGLVVLVLCLTFVAPLVFSWITITLYKEVLPKGWKIGTYVVAFIDEGLLLLSMSSSFHDFVFIPFMAVFALVVFNCAVAAIYGARKARRKQSSNIQGCE